LRLIRRMKMTLTKKEALRKIEEAVAANEEFKGVKGRLDVLKEDLTDWWFETGQKDGKKFESGDACATFSATDTFDPIEPSALYERLEALGKGAKFLDVVKVDLTALKDVLGKDDIRELQGEIVATKISVRLAKLKQ